MRSRVRAREADPGLGLGPVKPVEPVPGPGLGPVEPVHELGAERRRREQRRTHRRTMHLLSPLLLLLLLLSCSLTESRPPSALGSSCTVTETEVSCSDLSLHSAPLNLPKDILTLDLSRNQLQNLTRATLAFQTNLLHLNLHNNQIHFIQPGLFSDMTRLKVLDLSRNQLSALALRRSRIGSLGTVETLDLSANGLFTGMTDLLLHDSPSLRRLSLGSNSITKVSGDAFRGASSLRGLDLHNNVIVEIEEGAFDSLDHLAELDLSKNSIGCITDFDLYNLRSLNLSRNSVEAFQSAPSDRTFQLLHLDLSQNKLTLMPLLPRKHRLELLDLSHNQLRGVNVSGSFSEQVFFFCTCLAPPPSVTTDHTCFHHLKHLDLSYNHLESLPESLFYSMVSLQVLNVSNNCVTSFSLTARRLLPKLRLLNLRENSLQTFSISPDSLLSLEELYLDGNSLTVLDFRSLPQLRVLRLQQNELRVCPSDGDSGSCVTFDSVPGLEFLDLSQNKLEKLPANAFRNAPLKHLDLSGNPGLLVHRDAFLGLEDSLVHLSLNDNNISELTADLSSLTKLKYVDLSANQLTSLPVWSRDSSIESLNLQNNHLVSLDLGSVLALERSPLKTLYMGSNPLRCCANLALVHMLQRSGVVVADMERVTCAYLPEEGEERVNMEEVTQEMCDGLENGSVNVVVAVLGALVLAVCAALLLKCCQNRRRKRRRSYRA